MIEIGLRLLTVLIESWGKLTAALREAVLSSLLTTLMLLMLYCGWLIVHTGSLSAGLAEALLPIGARQTNQLQAELATISRREAVIARLLTAAIDTGRAARARLAIIHNGVSGITGIGLLRFDIIAAIPAEGRSAGKPVINAPLADWSGYLPLLLAGTCSPRAVADMTLPNAGSERQQLQEMGAVYRLACPVTDQNGQLLGGLFLTWDGNDPVPEGAAMVALIDQIKQIGQQLGIALSITPPEIAMRAHPNGD